MEYRRTIDRNNLMSMCIEYGFYTRGNNEEYENLLNSVDGKNITGDDIARIATDVLEHSSDEAVERATKKSFTEMMYIVGSLTRSL